MEFNFSNEEKLLQVAVNDFARKELANKEFDRLNHAPRDIIEKMGDLGFLCLKIPEKYGGDTGSWVEIGILAEEIAKQNISVAYLLMLSYEVCLLLATHGTEAAREEWLSGLCHGRKLGCIAVTEPHCGSDVAAINTKATRDGDAYIINGKKGPVSFGMEADMAVLFVKNESGIGGKGITSFLVPADLPGITKTSIKEMGLLPSAPASFVLKDVNVPVKYRIGEEGEGFHINRSLGFFSDFNQVISGLVSLGLAQTAMRLAISYAKQRTAFGRPIGQFEAISGKIAEDATLIEAGKWLCYRALWLKDQRLQNTKEAAMCGWWCPKLAFDVIANALLIHGHSGYSDDHPFQQMLRDVTGFEIIAGSEQILKLIIAERIIGKAAVPASLLEDIDY